MTAIAWQQFLQEQYRVHGKSVFSVAELGNVAGRGAHALNVELARLCRRGVLWRYAQGRYGLPGVVKPEALLPHMDGGAYITGMYALNRHNIVTQVPVEITCFTNRRHNLSRMRQTSVGRFVFVCVVQPVYRLPAEGVVASAEQALCDYVLLSRRRGLDIRNLVTLRNMDRINPAVMDEVVLRYPRTVREWIVDLRDA